MTSSCGSLLFEVDEEKKVEAVREFYANVLGDFNAVQKLQLISIDQKSFSEFIPAQVESGCHLDNPITFRGRFPD